MSSTTNSQVRFQLNLIKSIKSALLGLASLAVLLAAMSYAKPASAAWRHYARTNGSCLQVRTSPSIYAPVVGCVSNGTRLPRVVRYQNGFARLANGRFVSANWISSRRPSNFGVGGPMILSYGSTGPAVSAVQRRLGISSNGTGYFGSTTREAVRNFQLANGLTPDGIVGINTRRAMGFF
jgi:murein L,D-transpeptidase YcbB/YkuD